MEMELLQAQNMQRANITLLTSKCWSLSSKLKTHKQKHGFSNLLGMQEFISVCPSKMVIENHFEMLARLNISFRKLKIPQTQQ